MFIEVTVRTFLDFLNFKFVLEITNFLQVWSGDLEGWLATEHHVSKVEKFMSDLRLTADNNGEDDVVHLSYGAPKHINLRLSPQDSDLTVPNQFASKCSLVYYALP